MICNTTYDIEHNSILIQHNPKSNNQTKIKTNPTSPILQFSKIPKIPHSKPRIHYHPSTSLPLQLLLPLTHQLHPRTTNTQLPRLLNLGLENYSITTLLPHFRDQCLTWDDRACEADFDVFVGTESIHSYVSKGRVFEWEKKEEFDSKGDR